MTAVHNFRIGRGETFATVITWKNNDVPVNLTGYTARMQLRREYSSSSPALSLTSGSGLTLGGSAGTVTISINAATTADLVADKYVYDLELVSSGGVVKRLLEGQIKLTPSVTR